MGQGELADIGQAAIRLQPDQLIHIDGLTRSLHDTRGKITRAISVVATDLADKT